MTTNVVQTVDVAVPVSTAYNQWTQFEKFPEFMEGVESVTQLTDDRLHWKAEIAGQKREWFTEITEQSPDKRVAWTTHEGQYTAGSVDFHYLDENRSRVTLQMKYEPEGAIEKIGDALGAVKLRVKGDLKRFKEYIESRGEETGAWRGEIHQENVERSG